MKELKSLIDIVSRHKTKQVEIIDQHTDEQSKIYRLYDGIAAEQYTSDEEAMEDLYPNDDSNQAYKKLKYRLKKRLINTLFFIDVNKAQFTDQFKAYHRSSSNWAASRLLLARNLRNVAVEEMEKIIPIAEKYEFIDLLMLVSRDLSNHYGFYEIQKNKHRYYNKILENSTKVFQAEIEVESYYSEIMSSHYDKLNMSEEEEKELMNAFKKVKKLQKTGDTFRLNLYAYYVQATILEFLKKFEELNSICAKALSFFKDKKHQSNLPIVNFYIKKIIALSQLKKYADAIEAISKAEEIIESSSYNYYLLHYYHLIMLIHMAEYIKAYELIQELISQDNFSTLPQSLQEHFRIANAYMHFLLEIGKVDREPEKPFKIFKFLNEVPIYSKDKRGLNISILIVHILFLLKKRRYADIIDRMEALRQYSYRYLSKGDTFRSNCFIKMILQLPQADFHPDRSHRYAEKYYDKLIDHPLEMAEQPSEIELIPYEDLWDLILEILADNYAETGRLPRQYSV